MNTFLKGLLAAFLGGAVSTATTVGLPTDPALLKSYAGTILAGALVGAGSYLTGLFSPVPEKKS